MAKGEQLKGALRREPRQQLTRVSPGVYRNQSGRLVNQRGQGRSRRDDGRPAINTELSQQVNDLAMRYEPGKAPTAEQLSQLMQQFTGQVQDGLGRPSGQTQMPQTTYPSWMAPGAQGQMPQAAYPSSDAEFQAQFQPSANQGGRFRLSPGVYGTREQAMRQFEQQRQQMAQNMQQYQPYLKNK